jgi:hypothetical protein
VLAIFLCCCGFAGNIDGPRYTLVYARKGQGKNTGLPLLRHAKCESFEGHPLSAAVELQRTKASLHATACAVSSQRHCSDTSAQELHSGLLKID